MNHLRRLTRCRVPGHGDRCIVARERQGRAGLLWMSDTYPRSTEKRLAMQFEDAAEGMDPRLVPAADFAEYVAERWGRPAGA